MERTMPRQLRRCRDWYKLEKRCLDVGVSFLAIVGLWPFFLLICLLVWLDCPAASPLFVQTRVGQNGLEFRMYKFRTMIPNAEQALESLLPCNEMTGPVFKLARDPRITPFGRILRPTGLDELPQLWNVLRGDMSLVGPRPPLPRETAQYGPRELQRLTVRPGITCLWQIQPDRNSLSFERWMELDLQYLQTRSLRTDFHILLATARTLLRRDGR